MRLSSAIIAYILTFFLTVALPSVSLHFWKKKNKFSFLHMMLGMIFFFVFLVAYVLVLKFHLSIEDGINNYYNTVVYRVTIISLMTALITVLLWIFGMRVYVRRQAIGECMSFYFGFGCLGAMAIGLYSLVMLVMLCVQYFTSTLLCFDESIQAFRFTQDVFVAVFTPIFGHVSFAVAFLSFAFISVSIAALLKQYIVKKISLSAGSMSFAAVAVSLIILVDIVVFMKMFKMSHVVMAIIAVCLCGISAAVVFLLSKHEKKEEKGYIKQFD